jgi:hypothetical protein
MVRHGAYSAGVDAPQRQSGIATSLEATAREHLDRYEAGDAGAITRWRCCNHARRQFSHGIRTAYTVDRRVQPIS